MKEWLLIPFAVFASAASAEPWSLTTAADVDFVPHVVLAASPEPQHEDYVKGGRIATFPIGWTQGTTLEREFTIDVGGIVYRVHSGTALGRIVKVGDRPLSNQPDDPAIYCTLLQNEGAPPDVDILAGKVSKADYYLAAGFHVCFVDDGQDGDFDKAFISFSRKEAMQGVYEIAPIPYAAVENRELPAGNSLYIAVDGVTAKRVKVGLGFEASYGYFTPAYVVMICAGRPELVDLKRSVTFDGVDEPVKLGEASLVWHGAGSRKDSVRITLERGLEGCKFEFRGIPDPTFIYY